ncbi:hypothetical protein [Crassaminicella profunda]|jgi:hypothetical protein|uniref:hypothetical protein n=1 Tax=Crassaminicella profunda TaxID=1286698 RepID=UPI001FED25A1|nr:hypothetical protein [Crassaminicella profunda]
MGRKTIELDDLFPEDIEKYCEIARNYMELTTENFAGAFEIAQKAWALADRWNDLQASASKLAAMKGVTKTELQKYCYGKYRQMQLIHEHCRSLWRVGEEINKYNKR